MALPAIVVALLAPSAGAAPGAFVASYGSPGSGPGQLHSPHDLALAPGGRMHVADHVNGRIETFDLTGERVGGFQLASPGDSEPAAPTGLDVDAEGGVYVADAANHVVKKLSADGELLARWGGKGSTDGLLDVPGRVHVAGRHVYVSDVLNRRIQRFGPDGEHQLTFGGPDEASGGLQIPIGVTSDRAGDVLVADAGGHRIVRFDDRGRLLGSWGSRGTGPGELSYPHDVHVGPTGVLYVSDSLNHRIQAFSPAGEVLLVFGGPGSGPGELWVPQGMATDPSGRLHVVELLNHRVSVFEGLLAARPGRPATPPGRGGNAPPAHSVRGGREPGPPSWSRGRGAAPCAPTGFPLPCATPRR